MAAFQAILLIELRIPGCILPGHKILSGEIMFIIQTASHDLFDLAVMDIDTWTKTHKIFPRFPIIFPIIIELFFFCQTTGSDIDVRRIQRSRILRLRRVA